MDVGVEVLHVNMAHTKQDEITYPLYTLFHFMLQSDRDWLVVEGDTICSQKIPFLFIVMTRYTSFLRHYAKANHLVN